MIKEYSLKTLQKAINLALALDESMPNKIAALHGKVLEIIVTPLEVNFFIGFAQQQLKLLATYHQEADAVIRSSPMGLIRLSLLPASKVRSLFNDQIKISGDVELGQEVKKLFDELDIDWEGHLARFTGDVVAYQMGSIFRQGLAFKRQLSSSLNNSLSNYFHEELNILPPREALENFFTDVDQLADDVERLQIQINQLVINNEFA